MKTKKSFSPRRGHFVAKATIFFTTLTALLLFALIWEVFGMGNELLAKIIATSITLASLCFVSFLVASFYKK